MNTCGTCKYKGDAIEGWDDDMDKYGPTGFFLCTFIEQKIRGEEAKTKAYVKDGSDYYAALCVDDDFGCTLWEGK